MRNIMQNYYTLVMRCMHHTQVLELSDKMNHAKLIGFSDDVHPAQLLDLRDEIYHTQ